MAKWSFRCFVSKKGVDEVRVSYDAESKAVQGKFRSRFRALSALPWSDWVSGGVLAKDLSGPCAGLTEIRFLADNVQQRPLGFRSGSGEFTVLVWAHEKGGEWVEKNACKKALERKAIAEKDRKRTNALWLALD